MALDLALILAIPIKVSQVGSLPWLLTMLIALNFGTTVIVVRVMWKEFTKSRRRQQVIELLTQHPRQHKRR